MKFYITKRTLKSAKQFRKDFRNVKYHGFKHLSWIKSINIEDMDEDNKIVSVNYKFGMKFIYEMHKITVMYLLKDCGFEMS